MPKREKVIAERINSLLCHPRPCNVTSSTFLCLLFLIVLLFYFFFVQLGFHFAEMQHNSTGSSSYSRREIPRSYKCEVSISRMFPFEDSPNDLYSELALYSIRLSYLLDREDDKTFFRLYPITKAVFGCILETIAWKSVIHQRT